MRLTTDVPDHPLHSALLLVVCRLGRSHRCTASYATPLALLPAGTAVTSPPAGNTTGSTGAAVTVGFLDGMTLRLCW
jgi:hypothetical protein